MNKIDEDTGTVKADSASWNPVGHNMGKQCLDIISEDLGSEFKLMD